jgi:hypothetical protein
MSGWLRFICERPVGHVLQTGSGCSARLTSSHLLLATMQDALQGRLDELQLVGKGVRRLVLEVLDVRNALQAGKEGHGTWAGLQKLRYIR